MEGASRTALSLSPWTQMLEYFRRSFRYDRWANRAVLEALRSADPVPPTALERFSHVLAAHLLWQGRLRGEAAPVPVWPDWSLDEGARWLERAEAGWAEWLETGDLAGAVLYINSKGERFESRTADVLTHVLLHAAYHRGQIASDLRAAGFEAPYTDFIHATRNGIVD